MSVRAIFRVADVWVEIYNGIARFPCDDMALVCLSPPCISTLTYLLTELQLSRSYHLTAIRVRNTRKETLLG